MTDNTASTIQLLNKTYTIKCPSSEVSNLAHASEQLNKHLIQKKAQFKHLDEQHLLLLAALQLSHEFVVEKQKQLEQNQQLSQLISLLESKLNHASNDVC